MSSNVRRFRLDANQTKRIELVFDDEPVELTGFVIDVPTGEPIADAAVTFRDKETRTDKSGWFELRGVRDAPKLAFDPQSAHSLMIVHEDYGRASWGLAVPLESRSRSRSRAPG